MVAYSVPGIIVGITVWMSGSNYVASDTCFLSRSNGVIWSFAGPIIVLMSISTLLFVKIGHIVLGLKSPKNVNDRDVFRNVRRTFMLCVSFMPAMGLPWLFVVLARGEVYLTTFFNVFSSLQVSRVTQFCITVQLTYTAQIQLFFLFPKTIIYLCSS